MGIAMARLRIEADFLQDADHRELALGHGPDAVDVQAFADDLFNRHARAQAAERILEHRLQVPAVWAHGLRAQCIQALGSEVDLALGTHQAQQRLAEGRLARTGFADDAQGTPAREFEADAIHSLDVALLAAEQRLGQGKPDTQAAGPDQRVVTA